VSPLGLTERNWRGTTFTEAGRRIPTARSASLLISARATALSAAACADAGGSTLGYNDQFGAWHPTHIVTENDTLGWCQDNIPSDSQTTNDGSGYTLSVTNYSAVKVRSRSGQIFSAPLVRNGSSGTVTDANGNQITENTSGQFFDTLSSTTPVLTVNAPAPPASATFTYSAPSGSKQYTTNYQAYTVQTHFVVSNVSEYGPLNNSLASSIALPDGSSYTFTYEQTPGSCTPLSGTFSRTSVKARVVRWLRFWRKLPRLAPLSW
jgi:hypothetical protein